MKSAELKAMTMTELTALRTRVDRAIASVEKRKKTEVRKQLEKQAKAMGFSLADLVSGGEKGAKKTRKPRKKTGPKYANPADKSQTWSGMGRRPAWVVAALEKGKKLDDLAI